MTALLELQRDPVLGVVVEPHDDLAALRPRHDLSVLRTYSYWPSWYENASAETVLVSAASDAPQSFDIG